MTRAQHPLRKAMPADLESLAAASGCSNLRNVDGTVCGLLRFNYTTALVVGVKPMGYDRRYCYEALGEAQTALLDWDGVGHPGGPWIKCKGAGVDLLNPDLV